MPKVNYLNQFDKSNVCLLVCCYISLDKICEDGFAGIDNEPALAKVKEASRLCNEAYTEIIRGVSFKQMTEIERYANCHEMVIEPKSLCVNAMRQNEAFVVSKEDVHEVCEHSVYYECMFCDKQKYEARNCRLKAALDRIGFTAAGSDKDCHFKGMGVKA